MFTREDRTFDNLRENSVKQWLEEMSQHEDLAVRGGVRVTVDYINHLQQEIERLKESNELKKQFLKRMKENKRKTVEVVAAIIQKDEYIFATQRGYGEFKDGWEFPGGKIEQGETPKEALVREIKEELNTEINVGKLLDIVEYDYPGFHLTMHCFMCTIKSGNLELKEHEAAKWLTKETLDDVDWLPADEGLIEKIRGVM
nr:(deoxy)nucleoside triphosphate pyrophosphohydrolase [Anaerostipes sp. 494a]